MCRETQTLLIKASCKEDAEAFAIEHGFVVENVLTTTFDIHFAVKVVPNYYEATKWFVEATYHPSVSNKSCQPPGFRFGTLLWYSTLPHANPSDEKTQENCLLYR